jgi:hypothetical protein
MMRRLLGPLVLLSALGVLVLAAPAASAEIVIKPVTTSEMSPLSLSQCSSGTVCAWENSNFTGNFSQWPASNTGCHNHSGNPSIRSGWNRSPYNVRYGGGPTLPPGYAFEVNPGENPITGEICWPV